MLAKRFFSHSRPGLLHRRSPCNIWHPVSAPQQSRSSSVPSCTQVSVPPHPLVQNRLSSSHGSCQARLGTEGNYNPKMQRARESRPRRRARPAGSRSARVRTFQDCTSQKPQRAVVLVLKASVRPESTVRLPKSSVCRRRHHVARRTAPPPGTGPPRAPGTRLCRGCCLPGSCRRTRPDVLHLRLSHAGLTQRGRRSGLAASQPHRLETHCSRPQVVRPGPAHQAFTS